jgi:hypothetical protein
MKKTTENKLRECPVCGYKTLPKTEGSFHFCKICWWEDDDIQVDYPDMAGANELSLNDYRAKWLKEHHKV